MGERIAAEKAAAAEEARIEAERIAALGAQRQAAEQAAAQVEQLETAAKQTRDEADRTAAPLKTDAKTRNAALAEQRKAALRKQKRASAANNQDKVAEKAIQQEKRKAAPKTGSTTGCCMCQ